MAILLLLFPSSILEENFSTPLVLVQKAVGQEKTMKIKHSTGINWIKIK